MNNFNLNLLKYFYYVAIHKGFTNASKILNIAQPALSYNVKKLEEEMGFSLIDRRTNHFELTEDGKRIFEILKSAFGMIESNIEYFTTDNESYNEISIGIRQSIPEEMLMDLSTKFIDNRTNLKININYYSETDATNKLVQKEYDIIFDFDYNISKSDELQISPLVSVKNYFVCGKNYILKNNKSLKMLKRLNGEFLISPRPSRRKGLLQKFCHDNDIAFLDVISVDNSKLYNMFIINNFGIGLVNEFDIKSDTMANEIKILNIDENIFSDNIQFAYLKKSKSKVLSELVLFLENYKFKGDN